MRILYLCHRMPYPPNKGEKIRAFHQLKAIAERHEIDLFTLADHGADLACQRSLLRYCREVTVVPFKPVWAKLTALPFLLTRQPLSLAYFRSSELQWRIRSAMALRDYDRIVVFCSSMAQYVWRVQHIPTLLDLVDVDSDKWLQYAAFQRFPFSAICEREGHCLKQYERRLYRRFPLITVTTEREAQLVKRACSSACVHILPNGVDTTYFQPLPPPAGFSAPVVTFVGDMAYYPNEKAVLFFAREVLPLLRKSFPEVRFFVVGRDPGPKVLALKHLEGVEVTGTVADVRPYLARTTVSVVPLFIATGIQNKILESMAFERPVVATSRAVQGISEQMARLIDVGDNAHELAEKIGRWLSNPHAARQRGVESRQQILAECGWKQSDEQLLQLLEHPQVGGMQIAS